MRWNVEISKVGERDLKVLDRSVRREVLDRLEWLAENFESITPFPLHGQWRGFFKLRVNDWRVVYRFEASMKLIDVRIVENRSKIYKRRA